jgi:hypothetical protein
MWAGPDLPNDTAASLGSAFADAAKTPLPGVANLSNTVVVENTTASDPRRARSGRSA